jgi:anti-anti-sigma factor
MDLSFEGRWPVIALRGDLDLETVPTVRAMLDALVTEGHKHLVLDLSRLDFVSAGGLGVIASTLLRLPSGLGTLTIREPSAQARRLLDVVGLTERLTIESHDRSADLRLELARDASRLVLQDAVDAQLSLVVAVAGATVAGADGASVTLQRNGGLSTVAATNATVMEMDAHQYATGEGPCLSAAAEGLVFHVDSLAEELRWPTFIPLAREEGIASIMSTPLRAGGGVIGALNIYSNTDGAFAASEHELAARLAREASLIVAVDLDAEREADELASRIAAGLRSRLALAQAQGVLMAREHITADEATDALHRLARAAGASVLDQASGVIASTHLDMGPVERLGDG